MKNTELDKKVTKKVRRQIEEMGWPLWEPTWNDVFRRLMEHERFYVMAMPLKDFRWNVGIVILGRPNKLDGLMNMVDLNESLPSYDAAIRKGAEFVVNSLLRSRRRARKAMLQPGFEEFVEENKKRLREKGFDIDE